LLYDDYITVEANSDRTGIKISCNSAMPDEDQIYFYRVSATARFTSGVERSASTDIVVTDDVNPIVSSN
jgi:hypothetical protein